MGHLHGRLIFPSREGGKEGGEGGVIGGRREEKREGRV